MRTGTLAAATRLSLSRTARMVSERPKTTSSGGISPRDCTSELTGPVAAIRHPQTTFLGAPCHVHPKSQTEAAGLIDCALLAMPRGLSGLGRVVATTDTSFGRFGQTIFPTSQWRK